MLHPASFVSVRTLAPAKQTSEFADVPTNVALSSSTSASASTRSICRRNDRSREVLYLSVVHSVRAFSCRTSLISRTRCSDGSRSWRNARISPSENSRKPAAPTRQHAQHEELSDNTTNDARDPPRPSTQRPNAVVVSIRSCSREPAAPPVCCSWLTTTFAAATAVCSVSELRSCTMFSTEEELWCSGAS